MVYQTYCINCKERDKARIETKAGEDHKKRDKQLKDMKLHKYIGESSRSSYYRGQEHQNDMRQLKPSSHMLRHALDNGHA